MKAPRPEDLPIAQRLSLIRQAADVLKKQPNNAVARYNYAILLKANKEYRPAIENLKKVLKLNPKDMDVLTIIAETCLEIRDYTMARKYARVLVEKFPKDASCRMFYADILTKMGKPDQALKQYEQIKILEPDNPEVHTVMSQAARMIGKSDEIQTIQKGFQEIDPLNPNAIYSEAHNRKNTKEQCADLDERIEKSLEKADTKIAISSLNYSRGKIWSDNGEYDRAFAAYKIANEILELEQDATSYNIISNSRNTFSRQFLRLRENFGSETRSPVFILGMPRSGTTLVESICGAHKKITAGDELLFMGEIGERLNDTSPHFQAFKASIEQLSKNEISDLAKVYLDKTASLRMNTPHFTDKMPHNFMRLGMIRLMFPNATLIHCRRHPIDNCLSIYTNSMTDFHGKYKADLTRLGLYYRQYWQLMQYWRENIPGGFHEVCYEDVVANTELNARKMIEYIGLEWEDNVMDRQKSQKSVKTLSAWQVRQPVYTSSAGRWKNYEKHLGPLIDALGPVVEDYENELKALGQ